jgi:hypothetical protein
MDNIILVLYVNVGILPDDEVGKYVKDVSDMMFRDDVLKKIGATSFIIPVREGDTRLECIHPKFILDSEVYKEYESKLKELNNNLEKAAKDDGR